MIGIGFVVAVVLLNVGAIAVAGRRKHESWRDWWTS